MSNCKEMYLTIIYFFCYVFKTLDFNAMYIIKLLAFKPTYMTTRMHINEQNVS